MGKKIFVSYKHSDSSVQYLAKYGGTARAYVDNLIDLFKDDDIYKGEGNEDLSDFKDETIETRLKDKIYDSSITIVLISLNMKDSTSEDDQWIPWEISYSLKEITRGEKTSHTNAVLAVTLPDINNSYRYYIDDDTCTSCHCRILMTGTLFKILGKNMFNIKKPTFSDCTEPHSSIVYTGDSCYIYSVEWKDFIADKDSYLDKSISIRDNKDAYNLAKEVT